MLPLLRPPVCNEECLNVGLGQCTSLGADECCPFYHDAGMGFQCVSSCPENFVANASFFCSESRAVCMSSGTSAYVHNEYWVMYTNLLPLSVRTCANLTDPADGQVTYSPSDTPRFVGTVATYSCEQGFDVVEGDMERTCQSDGTWTGSEPSCQRCKCYMFGLLPLGLYASDVHFPRNLGINAILRLRYAILEFPCLS